MCLTIEQQMQKAAMENPSEALPAIGITTKSSVSAVSEVFLAVYIEVKGGRADNPYTRSEVNDAVRNWMKNGIITEWIARACVLRTL